MKSLVDLVKLNYYSLSAMGKSFLLLLAMGIGYQFIGGVLLFMGPAVLLLMLNYSALAYEDKHKFNNMVYLLPVNPRKYVLSKFVYGFLNIGLVLIVSNLINVIVKTFNITDSTTAETLSTLIILIGLFMIIIVVPIALIVGFNKGRYVVALLAMVPIFSANFLFVEIQNIQVNFSASVIKIIIILTAILLTLVSYFITSNLYEKKEIE